MVFRLGIGGGSVPERQHLLKQSFRNCSTVVFSQV